jgi:hypothetical protein
MKHQKNYTIFDKEKIVAFFAILIIVAAVAFWAGSTFAEEEDGLATVYVMCDPRPGRYVHVRRKPSADSMELGRLECGDSFLTDGESKNGWIHCCNIGENCGGWVYSGFVTVEKPEMVMQQYCSVSRAKLIIRRWQGGPQVVIDGKKQYLKNCEDVTVFCIADGWACTSRGYIKSEFLEVDPE